MKDQDVDRLARVRDRLADIIGECRHNAKSEEIADALIAAGVTLSAPEPPPTPLQAAAEAMKAWAHEQSETPTDTVVWGDGARAVLAAAVVALPNAKDAVTERADHVLIDRSWILRSAMLAALTGETPASAPVFPFPDHPAPRSRA